MNRRRVVEAGAIPALVELLHSQDTDIQYCCVTALSNIAVDGQNIKFDSTLLRDAYLALGVNRRVLAQDEQNLVQDLVQLLDSASLNVQCQVALALRNLACDGESQATVSEYLVYFSLQRTIS